MCVRAAEPLTHAAWDVRSAGEDELGGCLRHTVFLSFCVADVRSVNSPLWSGSVLIGSSLPRPFPVCRLFLR